MIRMQFGECFTTSPTTAFMMSVIDVEQIIAAHAGLARNACRDHHDVGIGGVLVVLRADHVGITLFDGHGLKQVQPFTLRNAFHDVDQHDIGQFFRSDPVGRRSAHIARSYDCYFFAHKSPL